MSGKEIRLKCIECAFQYAEYLKKMEATNGRYKTPTGIISLAKEFENYVENGTED